VLWQRLQVSAQIWARPFAGGEFGFVPSALSIAGEVFAATGVGLDCEPEDWQPVNKHASRDAPAVRERSCAVEKRFMILFPFPRDQKPIAPCM
jgi:hypothetical protein